MLRRAVSHIVASNDINSTIKPYWAFFLVLYNFSKAVNLINGSDLKERIHYLNVHGELISQEKPIEIKFTQGSLFKGED